MDRSRKASRAGSEVTLQHQSQQEALLVEELIEEKLAQLQTLVEHSKQTPSDDALLQKRIKHFGDCQRIEGETSAKFYERLRHWFDREIPQTKSPLHPPRQTGG